MFRKLVATLAVVGLVLSSNISAGASTPSWSTIVDSVAADVNTNVRLQELPNGNLLMVQQNNPRNGFLELTARVRDTKGVLSAPVEIASLSGMTFREEYTTWDIKILRDGTIAIAWSWTTRHPITFRMRSYVYVSYSKDGKTWTSPVSPLPVLDTDGFGCDWFGSNSCGYWGVALAVDSTNRIALVAEGFEDIYSGRLLATSSQDGQAWTAPAEINNGIPYTFFFGEEQAFQLKPLKSGFGLSYTLTAQNGEPWEIRFAQATRAKSYQWSSAERLGIGDVNFSHFIEAANGDLRAFWWSFPGDAKPSLFTARYQASTDTWMAPTLVFTSTEDVWYEKFSTNGYNGVITWMTHTDEVPNRLWYLRLAGTEMGSIRELVSPTDPLGFNSVPIETQLNQDLSFSTVMMYWNNPNKIVLHDVSATGTVSSQSYTPQGNSHFWATYRDNTYMSPTGNVTYIDYIGLPTATFNVVQVARSSAPVASIPAKITGAAKVGATLKANSIAFTSISGSTPATFSWLACSKPVTAAASTLPKTCLPIKGAKAQSFKLTKAEANKYIVVAISSSNAVGKTQLVSASTKKVK